jgi:hypothetical protein
MTDCKSLREVVLDALQLHADQPPRRLEFAPARRLLVVASGNALPTGKVIFQNEPCVFANEGDYLHVLRRTPDIDAAVVISASGEKDAPKIVTALKPRLPTCLLTCNGDSSAAQAAERSPAGQVFVTRKNKEPITYNTSTYMGMMLAKTGEGARAIREHLLSEVEGNLPEFRQYQAFFLLVRPEFDVIREMFLTKFDELFGPRLLGRCYTWEQTAHAKTVVPWEEELFLSFGVRNEDFGFKESRWHVPLPPKAGFVAMMATGYYVIGRIQEAFPAWFKKNREEYKRFQKELFARREKAGRNP